MEWENIDWRILEALRTPYLAASKDGIRDYWSDQRTLEHYDLTFGQRIGWKWVPVLEELQAKAESLARPVRLLDFGCGTGVAIRKWLEIFGPASVDEVLLHDRSAVAMRFAGEQVRLANALVKVKTVSTAELGKMSWDVMLCSHVTTEMQAPQLADLIRYAQNSAMVILVEPGTPAAAKSVAQIRESLRATHDFIAPCPHQNICGMLAPERGGDWCHHFAEPPNIVFRHAGWREFAKKMGIDLRSLPLSYLVAVKKGDKDIFTGERAVDGARLMGRARAFKGYATYLMCRSDGVKDEKLLKRDDPENFKLLTKTTPFAWPASKD